MDPYRTNRLNQSILKVLGELLQQAVKDPRVGFVTLNGVKLNRDHTVAEVFYSVLGDEQERRDSLIGLKKARGFLQSKLSHTLKLRAAPDLRFVYDRSVEQGLELDGLLDELAGKGEFLSEQEKRRRTVLADLVPAPALIAGLRDAEMIWIAPHWNPDPDAMGSALALAEALEACGRQVRVLGYPDPPVALESLPDFDRVALPEDPEALYAEDEPDALVLVDCHRIDRCGEWEEVLERFGTRWCIDHHLVSGRKAPETGWVEPRACSCCTLVYRVIEELAAGDEEAGDDPFAMTVEMATNLYAGLINDTGGFRFSNTGPLTFDLAGILARLGVDTAEVARSTLYRHRRQGLDMLQRVLASFSYHADGRILVARATQAMLAETGASLADTEGFVNTATAVDCVRYVAFLKEIDRDLWRVSLRVRGEGDVQRIAAAYGGGGHQQAAGCTIAGDGDEVAARLVAALTDALPA